MITKEQFDKARRCLIQNGVERDEAETVLQALCYILMGEETEQYFDDDMYPYDGMIIPCPDCGEHILIEYDTARCEECGWMAADADLEDVMEG